MIQLSLIFSYRWTNECFRQTGLGPVLTIAPVLMLPCPCRLFFFWYQEVVAYFSHTFSPAESRYPAYDLWKKKYLHQLRMSTSRSSVCAKLKAIKTSNVALAYVYTENFFWHLVKVTPSRNRRNLILKSNIWHIRLSVNTSTINGNFDNLGNSFLFFIIFLHQLRMPTSSVWCAHGPETFILRIGLEDRPRGNSFGCIRNDPYFTPIYSSTCRRTFWGRRWWICATLFQSSIVHSSGQKWYPKATLVFRRPR